MLYEKWKTGLTNEPQQVKNRLQRCGLTVPVFVWLNVTACSENGSTGGHSDLVLSSQGCGSFFLNKIWRTAAENKMSVSGSVKDALDWSQFCNISPTSNKSVPKTAFVKRPWQSETIWVTGNPFFSVFDLFTGSNLVESRPSRDVVTRQSALHQSFHPQPQAVQLVVDLQGG